MGVYGTEQAGDDTGLLLIQKLAGLIFAHRMRAGLSQELDSSSRPCPVSQTPERPRLHFTSPLARKC